MEHRHLDAVALEHLLAADRTAKQNEQLFHLLAVCPRCREVGGWLLELHQANALPPVFGPIDAALARSRAEAVHLADLSVHVADRIAEGGLFEESWVYQLRSLAWAALGNARRVQGDHTGAERSFEMADTWWEAGTRGTSPARASS